MPTCEESQLTDLMKDKLGWEPHVDENGVMETPFSVEQENFHSSKKEFLRERKIVLKAIKDCGDLFSILTSDEKDVDPKYDPKSVSEIKTILDARAKISNRNRPFLDIHNSAELICRNAMQVGLSHCTRLIVKEVLKGLLGRKLELSRQENEYWTAKHRPPNYYARTIALRLAKFYVSQTEKTPTLGTSRDGPHPSTEYGRLLEEVFSILGIEAQIRGPGKWAISELEKSDFQEVMSIGPRGSHAVRGAYPRKDRN